MRFSGTGAGLVSYNGRSVSLNESRIANSENGV